MEITADALLKIYGPLGLIVFALAVLIWKKLLPYIEQQQAENRAILIAALDDARKERDSARQARDREVDKFLDSLRQRDAQFTKAIADAVNSVRRQK